MDRRIKSAIARIDTRHQGQTGRGTGFLVGDGLVLTALHVVGNRRSDPPEPFDGPILLTFRGHEPVQGQVIPESMHADEDWALVRCAAPEGIEPLPVWTRPPSGARWTNWGFPDSNPHGLAQSGHIEDDDALLGTAPAIQLFSKQAAAGRGAMPRGWSGSPVIVDGKVVGLLRFALMQDGRAEAGTLYACPVSLVLDDYPDADFVVEEASLAAGDTALRVSDYLFELGPGEYHVLVLHRPADAAWANALVARLEGAGLHVSGMATAGGPDPEGTLAARLQRCRMALVLCTESWLATPAWRAESDAILSRALRSDGFRTGLVRVDASPVPESWALAPQFDFSSAEGPLGPEFDRLQFAVAGREAPAADSGPHRTFRVETEEAGKLLRSVREATADGPHGLNALWREWAASGRPLDTAALIVGDALLSQGRPKEALDVLEAAHDGVRARQLRALALSDTGRVDESIELLEQLRESGELDAETSGLLGGRYKRLWQASGERRHLERSYRIYADAFERTLDHYPGINAAALALRLGNAEESRELAERVRETLARVDHWTLATEAEVHLLVGDLEAARAGYASAVARIPHDDRSIATMRRQARETLEVQGLARDALDTAFPLSRPVVFTGHRVDAPGRTPPRFPPENVDAVRAAIRSRLDELGGVYGFASAADGADIVFLEELLARGGSAEVLLPFPAEDFRRTSVADDWSGRFEQLLQRTDRIAVSVLAESPPQDDELPAAFARCNAALQERARARGELIDEEPLLLAVWDGTESAAEGGTGSAVRSWRDGGGAVDRIDPRAP